jgi:hypothetical protein
VRAIGSISVGLKCAEQDGDLDRARQTAAPGFSFRLADRGLVELMLDEPAMHPEHHRIGEGTQPCERLLERAESLESVIRTRADRRFHVAAEQLDFGLCDAGELPASPGSPHASMIATRSALDSPPAAPMSAALTVRSPIAGSSTASKIALTGSPRATARSIASGATPSSRKGHGHAPPRR